MFCFDFVCLCVRVFGHYLPAKLYLTLIDLRGLALSLLRSDSGRPGQTELDRPPDNHPPQWTTQLHPKQLIIILIAIRMLKIILTCSLACLHYKYGAYFCLAKQQNYNQLINDIKALLNVVAFEKIITI